MSKVLTYVFERSIMVVQIELREFIMQITYKGYCALGGASNPRCWSRDVYMGKHYMHTAYYLMGY